VREARRVFCCLCFGVESAHLTRPIPLLLLRLRAGLSHEKAIKVRLSR
jgi:hypothetical protein